MALSDKQLKHVCCLGLGRAQCRYLDEVDDDQGGNAYVCKKLSPDRKLIDEEIALELADRAKNGKDPNTFNDALGDHCQGYVTLRSKPQGYDV